MRKTAMQMAIDKISNVYLENGADIKIITILEELLEAEKQQIVEAYEEGMRDEHEGYNLDGEDYLSRTFQK